ncbi:MAG: hypothetical protein K1X94_33305 [Sandaracinaceae bacterium]|nr:hypothetical protein [Sandaracinaceae bacterium]
MSVLESLELRAQLEARRALGPAALVAWATARLIAEPPSRVRTECVRAALVEAVRLADLDAIELLAPMMIGPPRIDARPLLDVCQSRTVVESAASLEAARCVVDELVRIEPTLSGLLVLAGLEERLAHIEAAVALLGRAMSRAEALADREGALRARVERARVLVRADRAIEALEDVDEIERLREARDGQGGALALSPRDELVLAAADLRASGRYRRVRGLDRLLALVAAPSPAPRASLRLLGQHVDRMGRALTSLELDRARSVLSAARAHGAEPLAIEAIERAIDRVPMPEAEREALLARELAASSEGRALLDRARAVRDGGTSGPEPASSASLHARWLALSVIAHLRARRVGEALKALLEIERMQGMPGVLEWTMLARAASERALRAPVIELASRWLGRPAATPPARGYLHLALQLERAGLSDREATIDLVGLALRRAREANEDDARALSIQHAIRAAWLAHARGELAHAHRLLEGALQDASPRTS